MSSSQTYSHVQTGAVPGNGDGKGWHLPANATYHIPGMIYFIVYFFRPVYCRRRSFFSLPPTSNSDLESHGRLFSPVPTAFRAFHFHCEKISAISSHVDFCFEQCLPTPGALSNCFWSFHILFFKWLQSGRLDVRKSGVCGAGLNRNMEWGVGGCTYVKEIAERKYTQ